jgi:multidrug efflux system membrane fusion protein
MIRRVLQIALPLAFLVAGGIGAMALIQSYTPPEPEPVVFEPPLVEVMEVKQERIRLTITAEGSVSPRVESELVPEISGRVTSVSSSLAIGGFFAAGDELLKIDGREYELTVTRARAAIAQSELRVVTEEQEGAVARAEWKDLADGEPTPLALRLPQLAEAKAALASAQAALEQAEFDLERTSVRAPFDGRVRRKQVDLGQYVQRGQAIATLYSTDVAEIQLPIPDQELEYVDLPLAYVNADSTDRQPRVVLSTEFAGSTYEWQGRIVRTEGEIDPETRMVRAIAQVQDPYAQAKNSRRPPLAVGMFVQAEIRGRAVQAISLPRTALRGADQVWVVNARNQLEFRQVDILRLERDRVLLRGGLETGERVCLSNLEAAVQGTEVRVAGVVTDSTGD